MAPTLVKGAKVYFLAEAPGQDEDENSGRPLTGPSGKLLRECIPDDEECSFDNIINCRPENNRQPTWNEIECCRPRRWKWIEEAKPKVIVGLGVIPLSWAMNKTNMVGMRGRPFAIKVGSHSCWFIPTYHPSFILRTAFDRDKPLKSRFGYCFKMDIQKAFEYANWAPPVIASEVEIKEGVKIFDGTGADDLEKVEHLLCGAIAAGVKAIDLETKGLRPYRQDAAIMTVAISHGDTNFAFAWDHPKAGWASNAKAKLEKLLKKLLTDSTIKVAHNVPFELEWLAWLFGPEVVRHDVWHCTQMQAHFVDERRGEQHGSDDTRRQAYQSLDFLVKQYFGISYKSLFKLDKKDMSKSDLTETLIYNGVDTKYTLRLFHLQKQLLLDAELWKAYLEALPRQPSVALMQYFGIGTDQAVVKKIQAVLKNEIEGNIMPKIMDLKVVKAFIKDNKEFNPLSDKDVVRIFKDYLKRKEVVIQEGEKVRYSTDKNILAQIDHPLADLIARLRNKNKMKSTYVDGLLKETNNLVYPDGLIHCNFNTTFAETGRTSSDDPNMQNFPQRKDSWVRQQVTAPPEHVILAFDYGQLEACTAAMCSGDKALTKALWEDYDIHMEWAVKIAKKYPAIVGGADGMKDKDKAKKFRSLIKNKLVFPAMFGAAVSSITGYLIAATGVEIPESVVEDLMDEFWETFHGLYSWQKKLVGSYYDTGYVNSPTGRRHRYPLTKSQIINYPIQSLACDIVCDAMNRLSFRAVSERAWHLHPRLNIHDDLTLCIPNNNKILEESIEIVYTTMLTPPYECVNVPLSVTASIGKNWAPYDKISNPDGMLEMGKFWSHRDVK